ncbi:MAG: FAD-binding protein [Micrococcales bacterium]|nr:FAD-binding protein [Micrococcales bacterium]
MYDVAIVGLGPAGSTLARLLPERLRVVAVDRKHAAGDGGFHKPCGGLLAPDAQQALASSDLVLPTSVLVDPQIFAVKTVDLAAQQVSSYQRFYLNMDRHRFDQWLCSLIPDRVDVRTDAVASGFRHVGGPDAHWELVVRQGQTKEVVRARHLVGADGARSAVRQVVRPAWAGGRCTAIQQWFTGQVADPIFLSVFDPTVTDSYAWGFSKNEYFVFGGAFPSTGARAAFDRLVAAMRPYGLRLDDPVRTEACQVLRPRRPRDFAAPRAAAFLVGEAAGFVSPTSLEGISYALRSARALAHVLSTSTTPVAAERRYWSATRSIRTDLLGKRLKSPFMYYPPLRRLVMASGLLTVSGTHRLNPDVPVVSSRPCPSRDEVPSEGRR